MAASSYYPETPGYEGWGQGVGGGLRAVACGGIGVILDGGGENTYEYDYLADGGGYWCGLGFARDFGGNTERLITRTAYNGGPCAYESYGRCSNCGWGCHYAMGFLFDDSGDDVYEGTIMGLGMAWDCSMGVLCDFAGNDHYMATGGSTQGTGARWASASSSTTAATTSTKVTAKATRIRASPTTTCPSAAATSASWSITAATISTAAA